MMIKLTSWSGAPLFVNPSAILALEPDINPGRTKVIFGIVDALGMAGLGGLVSETVLGEPGAVAALLGGAAMEATLAGGLIARAAMHARGERRAVAVDGDRGAI